jgi:predicted O-methyltransferase YrrM
MPLRNARGRLRRRDVMLTTDHILDLYRRYASDLKAVRRRQYWFHRWHENAVVRRLRKLRLRRHMLFPALDDLEAEITYLLIRERRPRVIVEMSPNAGWSTTWILSALRDNGDGGHLWSYDLHPTSTKFVPRDLAKGRWHFVEGDAHRTIPKAPDFDYLFVDSDHSREFARWYTAALFPRVKPGTIVSVHDVFHRAEPSEEGEVVMEWLARNGMTHWTPSPLVSNGAAQRIFEERKRLGIDYVIQHRDGHNPMLFFEMGQATRAAGGVR